MAAECERQDLGHHGVVHLCEERAPDGLLVGMPQLTKKVKRDMLLQAVFATREIKQ